MSAYTLGEPELGRYRVFREGEHVATIFEHPTRYAGGRASVSMRKIAWAGKQPSGYPWNPDPALFFDFVSDFTTAAETLPAVCMRVGRIIEWREQNP